MTIGELKKALEMFSDDMDSEIKVDTIDGYIETLPKSYGIIDMKCFS
jgi:hypothetical protein